MPAPWPNATEQASLAYEAAVRLADAEFENVVVKHAGPTVRKYVDAGKANFLPVGDWNLLGTYLPPGSSMSASELAYFKPIFDEMEGKTFVEDEVNAIGVRGAQPDVWGHEFKHRQFAHEKRTFVLGPSNEEATQYWDAFRASTPEQWYTTMRIMRNRGETLKETEQRVKKAFDVRSFRDQFIKEEVKARETSGDRPKNRGPLGLFSSLYKDQEEAFERRQRAWSLDKYEAQQALRSK